MGKIVKMDVPRKRQPGFGLFPKAKQILVDFIAYLIALFFVLAVTSKLMHLDKFETQLAESPFLSVVAAPLHLLIPAFEILMILLLVQRKTRLLGLYTAFSWFVLFTYYIAFLLNTGVPLPCACGGLWLSVGWTTQMLFNMGCIIIAITAILLQTKIMTTRK
uniref:MauE/DoxX family redox-associated membrane protein n=1 Tax=Pedobacter schmidteae TaxID=2201271 RepID=UPI000EAD6493|nr:MauE/DoxX family redox-associated membrane protein [Pedobacter schmidteae]